MTVDELYTDLLAAWNERDAARFGALFAPDGLLVGFDGSQVPAAEVAAHLGPIFGDHPTAAYVAKVRGIRALDGGAALLWAIAGMVPPGAGRLDPALNAVQTVVAEPRDNRLAIVLFQNTPAQYHGRPDLAERHTAELAALLSG